MHGTDNTSALAFGGDAPLTGTVVGLTEEWNGVSWVEVADLNVSKKIF